MSRVVESLAARGSRLLVLASLFLASCAATPPTAATATAPVLVPPHAAVWIGASAWRAPVQHALKRLSQRGMVLARPTWLHESVSLAAFYEETGTHAPVRAYTNDDVITVAPRTSWAEASDEAVVARLAHELCHAALAQLFVSSATARGRGVPRFYLEGLCLVVAEQGQAQLPLAEVCTAAATSTGPLALAAFQTTPTVAYAASYWLIADAVAQWGFLAVHDVLKDVATTAITFDEAWQKRTGSSVQASWPRFAQTHCPTAALPPSCSRGSDADPRPTLRERCVTRVLW